MQIPAVVPLSLPGGNGLPAVDDPEALLAQAREWGVLPAVCNNLLGMGVAGPARSEWAGELRRTYARNLALDHEETRLVDHLSGAGLPCRAVKGVRLVRLLYPDLSWRAVSDIDLLLPRETVSTAYEELKRLGLLDTEHPWDEKSLSRLLAQSPHNFPEIRLKRSRILVELHWDWTGEGFPAAEPYDDPEAFLVYLCRHAGKHFWSWLGWIADIELYRRRFGDELDWDRLWRLARKAGAERSCAASFHLASLLFGGSRRPEEARHKARAGKRLAERAVRELIHGGETRWWDHPAWQPLRASSWAQRVSRFLGWLVPPPSHWTDPEARRLSRVGIWLRRYRRLFFQAAARLTPSAVWKNRFRRAAGMSLRDWARLAEAWGALLLIETGLRAGRFDALRRWLTRVRRPAARVEPEMVRSLAWSVGAAANHHLVPMRCLARSVTLAWLLARRGCETELKLGVRREGDRIHAHAWLEWQGETIAESQDPEDGFAVLEPAGPSPGSSYI